MCDVFSVTRPVEVRPRFHLLGRFEVLRGQPVELPPSKKARALLAYLVATERAHDREHLAALLWDEREDARAALRWALTRLRPVVDDRATRLVADRDCVKFEAHGAQIDLAAVRSALAEGIDRASTETLEQAAGRFRGELLEGLDLSDCYGFHAWCLAEREAARALRASILSTIVDRLADDPARALPFARARLDLDPLAGAAQAAVVRTLGALGRQREAEELYQSLKQMVQTRLGERASGELERARAAIRRTPPNWPATPSEAVAVATLASTETGVAASAAGAPSLGAAAEPLARLARSPFVGRARELTQLTEALDAALASHGSFVEIAGEAGMGKSRLVEELVHQARLRGARVLVGRCLEGEASPAFLPFLDSLDTALGNEVDLERLVGVDAALATRLFPRLAARLREPVAPAMDATSERYLVFQAVATLLEKLAAPSGAVLIIEDLHWIDQPSLALLRYLAGRLAGTRLTVIATYRDEDLEPRKRDALVDLRQHGGARVALRGLPPHEVHALVNALGGADVPIAVRDRLTEATGGHPLFLQEMLKHLVEERALGHAAVNALSVPDGVRQVIGRRLTRLSERARRLLAGVSPMIGAFRWELVQAVSSVPEDDLLDALEEVLGAQLFHEGVVGGFVTYEFSHRLVAQTLHDSLPLPRRTRLHRQIGEAIEKLYANDLDEHLSPLAHHFFIAASDGSGQDKDKAIDYAVRAAERAASLLAFEEAARHYQRAATLLAGATPARLADMQRRRGRALAVVSAWDEACEAFELALAAADPGAQEWRAEVLGELGTASLWAMNMPAVYTRAQQADEIVKTLGREDLTLTVGGLLAQCRAADGDLPAAIEKYTEIRSIRRNRHVPSLSLAPLTLYWNGRIADSIVWATELLAAARAANDIVSLLVGLPPLGMALGASGRYREAIATFAEARAIGERARATSLLSRAVSMSTGIQLDLGDVDAAERLAGEARELGRMSGWAPGAVNAEIDLIVCHLRRGAIGGAETMIEQATRGAAEISARKPGSSGFHDWLWALRLAWARAEVAAARGDADEVERWAADTLTRAGGRRPKYEAAALVTRGRARAQHGRRAEALADLDRALAIARTSTDPALLLRVATPRLALDGNDQLAQEIRILEHRIATAR
jgi:DNA-binding SARP family transcriptional activator/tetratricopeptide (TPR) repeat protein